MGRTLSSSEVAIVGAAESPYTRHPPSGHTTEWVLVDAVRRALADGGLHRDDVDGLGLCSFTLAPDHAIDLAWRMGMSLSWVMEDTNGGACGPNMLQHAVHAIEAGDASVVVLVAGDRLVGSDLDHIADNYNRVTRDYLAPLPLQGPNTLFSFLTQRHMQRYGLEREDYGLIAISQRRWAGLNPGAVYRTPLTMEEYLAAPPVAPPLHRYDCVPPVTGADAIVVATRDRVPNAPAALVRAVGGSYNHDKHEGDGLSTGLAAVAPKAWERAGVGPEDVGLVCVYDDYPVMVLVQLADLGFISSGDPKQFLRTRLERECWPLNTSGGQLSAGQSGAGGGLHGLVEAAMQLRGRAGGRQVEARFAVVSGYGMVLVRHGACANLAILERA